MKKKIPAFPFRHKSVLDIFSRSGVKVINNIWRCRKKITRKYNNLLLHFICNFARSPVSIWFGLKFAAPDKSNFAKFYG